MRGGGGYYYNPRIKLFSPCFFSLQKCINNLCKKYLKHYFFSLFVTNYNFALQILYLVIICLPCFLKLLILLFVKPFYHKIHQVQFKIESFYPCQETPKNLARLFGNWGSKNKLAYFSTTTCIVP
jgi:hypothetical protein